MIIKKMTASYGRLQNESLELRPGLNIITAHNESGKSTWCSFIANMLYGIDSAAKEKAGVKPDKLRFAPWSGAAMSGTMELDVSGRGITLSRTGKEKAPLREVSATLSGTSQPVSDISQIPGESLLGIPREVFVRSAYIGQGSVPIGASPELERRIAAIVQTGDEGVSATDAEEKLRDAARKRRFNRHGSLPEIESEIALLREKLQSIDSEKQRGEQLRIAREQAITRRDELIKKVAESREVQRKQSLDTLTQSREKTRELEEAASKAQTEAISAQTALAANCFGESEPKTAREQAQADIDKIEQLGAAAKAEYGKARTDKLSLWVFTGTGVLSLIFAVLSFVKILDVSPAMLVVATLICAAAVLFMSRRLGKKKLLNTSSIEKQREILAKYGCNTTAEIWAILNAHEDLYNTYKDASNALALAQERLNSEREKQQLIEVSAIERLDFTSGSSDAAQVSRELSEAEDSLHRIREECAALDGRISALGDKFELEDALSQLEKEHEKQTFEYEALLLAADTLKQAGIEIQNRLTPELSRRTSEIFSRLTKGRYDSVALDRELKALAKLADDTLPRESAFLSVGALDQLYLALRLAICELALPEEQRHSCPLILDDALTNFDDERCALALELLREMSHERQILLFTCHSREAQLMKQYEDVNVVLR